MTRWRWILLAIVVLVPVVPIGWAATRPASVAPASAPTGSAPLPIPSPSMTVAEPPPLVNYSERTISLPGFNPLGAFVDDNNCPEGNCSQVPVLDGSYIYYIDNSSDLVRVSVLGGPSEFVSSIVPLYQGFSSYKGMIQNAFFIEDGTAYLTGTWSPSNISSVANLTVESVNLTTGGTPAIFNTTIALSPLNQGVFMISPTELVVASTVPYDDRGNSSAYLVAVNMTDGGETDLAVLPFFEANNLYWIPQLKEFIDVEAEGSEQDLVGQWSENPDGTFSLRSSVAFDNDQLPIDWVNGLGYNSTADEIAFTAGGIGIDNTYVLKLVGGTLTNQSETVYSVSSIHSWLSDQYFSGQQYAYTGDWDMGVFHNGTQYLFDPWTGALERANEPFTEVDLTSVCNGGCYLGQEATNVSTLIDFHASVALGDPFYRVVVATSSKV